MSEYKRLTQPNKPRFCRYKKQGVTDWEVVDRLADLEDKIESEQLVELPCKVGDTVYFYDFSEKEIMQGKVIGIRLNYYTPNNPIWVRVQYDIPMVKSDCDTEVWASMVFTDKSQAEARLKELKGEDV